MQFSKFTLKVLANQGTFGMDKIAMVLAQENVSGSFVHDPGTFSYKCV